MKRNNLKANLFTLCLILLFSSSVFAQFGQLGQVLSTGKDDATKIFETYLSPYANGMGAGLSTGWYNKQASSKMSG